MHFLDISEDEGQEEILRFLVEGTATAAGDLFFDQLVRTLAEALKTKFAFVSELADPEGKVIRPPEPLERKRLCRNVRIHVRGHALRTGHQTGNVCVQCQCSAAIPGGRLAR